MAPARPAHRLHQRLLRSSALRHIKLLAKARAACDRLIVGLNSDGSSKRLKGNGRPINPAEGRAEVIAALEAVDHVVVFEEDTPLELIKQVKPAVLVKGADYTREEIVGGDVVEAAGGTVVLVDVVPGHSTTGMVSVRPHPDRSGALMLAPERAIIPDTAENKLS